MTTAESQIIHYLEQWLSGGTLTAGICAKLVFWWAKRPVGGED